MGHFSAETCATPGSDLSGNQQPGRFFRCRNVLFKRRRQASRRRIVAARTLPEHKKMGGTRRSVTVGSLRLSSRRFVRTRIHTHAVMQKKRAAIMIDERVIDDLD